MQVAISFQDEKTLFKSEQYDQLILYAEVHTFNFPQCAYITLCVYLVSFTCDIQIVFKNYY